MINFLYKRYCSINKYLTTNIPMDKGAEFGFVSTINKSLC